MNGPFVIRSPDSPGRPWSLAISLCLAAASISSDAAQSNVTSTVHNLSVSGPGEIRSMTETEVCKFCHIPHSPSGPEALWSRPMSEAVYVMPEARSGSANRALALQPDGSSRLCLSCHDGTIALGEFAGASNPAPMTGTQRLTPGRKGFLGTDLSGGHPISFVVPDGDADLENSGRDMGLKSLVSITADQDVRLDKSGKMQCTTCHDPHSDRYYVTDRVPRFWVKPSVEEVCLTCHEPR
jgi:hypothetical protein